MFIFSLWRVVGATCSDRKERGTAAAAAARRHLLGLVVLCVTIMLTKYKRVKLASAKQSTWLHAVQCTQRSALCRSTALKRQKTKAKCKRG